MLLAMHLSYDQNLEKELDTLSDLLVFPRKIKGIFTNLFWENSNSLDKEEIYDEDDRQNVSCINQNKEINQYENKNQEYQTDENQLNENKEFEEEDTDENERKETLQEQKSDTAVFEDFVIVTKCSFFS